MIKNEVLYDGRDHHETNKADLLRAVIRGFSEKGHDRATNHPDGELSSRAHRKATCLAPRTQVGSRGLRAHAMAPTARPGLNNPAHSPYFSSG